MTRKKVTITLEIGQYMNGIFWSRFEHDVPYENANLETILELSLAEIKEILKREFMDM